MTGSVASVTRRWHAAPTFLLPSLLGVLVFLVPVPRDEGLTIGIGIATEALLRVAGAHGVHVVGLLIAVTAVLTVAASWLRVPLGDRGGAWQALFDVAPVWVLLRLASLAFVLVHLTGAGPAVLRDEAVTGAVYAGIGTNMLAVYVAACLLLPLLTDYGLMEFTGTLAGPLFRRLFRLPGRAAIDAAASVAGASAIGLMITLGQYERGAYTAREASIIASSFSIVSIPFSLVVARVAGIEAYFVPWYATVLATCLLAALLLTRVPPLATKPDTRHGALTGAKDVRNAAGDGAAPVPAGTVAAAWPAGAQPAGRGRPTAPGLLATAWHAALARAALAPGPRGYLLLAARNLAFFAFAVVAASLAIATLTALLVFRTPLFTWLGAPLVPLLTLAGLPEAQAAAGGLFSGFLDQYMPALAAAQIDSARTSFVLAGLSVCQLIYLSELGVIMLRSALPLGLADLLAIFLWRTIVALPLLVLAARWLVA